MNRPAAQGPQGQLPFSVAPRLDAPTPAPSKSKRQRLLTSASTSLVLVACALLGFSLWETRISGWMAERSQDALRSQFRAELAAPREEIVPALPQLRRLDEEPTPTTMPQRSIPAMPDTGELVGRLEIPAIDLDWMVVAGTDQKTLRKGPGAWLPGAFPGTPGNATLSAHRTTYGGPFRRLGDLVKGDRVFFTAPDGAKSVFEIRGMEVVSPSAVYVTGTVPGVRLTLLTCDPPGSAARRLVIQAELVEGPFLDMALPADEWRFIGK